MANHQWEHLGEEFKDEKTKKPSVVEKKSIEKSKLDMGVSKAERVETADIALKKDDMVFETELEADMATLIMNWLVSSVINTLAWMLYVSSVNFEEESDIGRVPAQVSLKVIYFVVLMIFVVTYLITHRPSVTKKKKLVTYNVLFLGIVCGLLGKLCMDTLGDIGKFLLFFWAVLCLLQHVLDVFTLALVCLLYSPIHVTQGIKSVPYWARGSLVLLVTLLVLPLIMSQTTFATFDEWIYHFSWWFRL